MGKTTKLTLLLLVFSFQLSNAQPGGCIDDCDPAPIDGGTSAPLDGGVSLLIGAAAVYGAKKLRKKK